MACPYMVVSAVVWHKVVWWHFWRFIVRGQVVSIITCYLTQQWLSITTQSFNCEDSTALHHTCTENRLDRPFSKFFHSVYFQLNTITSTYVCCPKCLVVATLRQHYNVMAYQYYLRAFWSVAHVSCTWRAFLHSGVSHRHPEHVPTSWRGSSVFVYTPKCISQQPLWLFPL